jgi:hypothetical protein
MRQNGFAERLIGSIRRECADNIIVLGEMHLRRVLKSYADYYNSVRPRRNDILPSLRIEVSPVDALKSHVRKLRKSDPAHVREIANTTRRHATNATPNG